MQIVRSPAAGLCALGDRAHAGGDLEADVVEQRDGRLDPARQLRVRGRRQQEQDIDVGRGIEFSAAITADGQQCQRRRQGKRLPEFAEHVVDQGTARPQQVRRIFLDQKALPQLGLAFTQP